VRRPLILVLATLWWAGALPSGLEAANGELELQVHDETTGEPMAAQLQLFNARNRSIQPAGLTRDGDWLVFDGTTVLKLPPGVYHFELRRGVEYRYRTGHFVLKSGAADNHRVSLPRAADMPAEGWYSGDLHVQSQRLPSLTERMLAADVHVLPAITWSNQQSPPRLDSFAALEQAVGNGRSLTLTHGLDRRDGSSTVLLHGETSASLPATADRLPPPFVTAQQLRSGDAASSLHVHLTRASAWDLPAWLASGQLNSIGLFHDGLGLLKSQLDPTDRPADPVLFPAPQGPGRWAQQIFFRLLDTGHRVAPAAGSGTDGSGNPLGFHRVYVHCGEQFTPEAWWEGLQAGRVMLTNGPLLRPRVNGQLPGHVFEARAGDRVELEVELQLSTQEKIQYLEIIQNGRPVQQVRLEDWAKQAGRLPPVVFDASGWMLVRVAADDPLGFRGAITGPYYVEFDGQPRISREASQFFLDWVYERARELTKGAGPDTRDLLEHHRVARDYWRDRLAHANAP
jgi:hypothetical protein